MNGKLKNFNEMYIVVYEYSGYGGWHSNGPSSERYINVTNVILFMGNMFDAVFVVQILYKSPSKLRVSV